MIKQHRNIIGRLVSPKDISGHMGVGLVLISIGAFLISNNTQASFDTGIASIQQINSNGVFLGETMTVVSEDISVPPGQTAELVVDCPQGYSALNGGVYSFMRELPIVSLSPRFLTNNLSAQPDGSNPAPSGWRAVLSGDSDAGGGMYKMIVVCGIRAGLETIVDSASAWPGLSVTVDCPPGKVVAGGGIDPVIADVDMIVMASMPESDTSWNGRMWDKAGSRV